VDFWTGGEAKRMATSKMYEVVEVREEKLIGVTNSTR